MSTRIIQLSNGICVEVEKPPHRVQQISGGTMEQVKESFDKIQPFLVRVCQPIKKAWQELRQDMNIERAEVELGLSFEGEGNLYVTKTKAGANLVVKLTLKPENDVVTQGAGE